MTATGLPERRTPDAGDVAGLTSEPAQAVVHVAGVVADGTDIEARHRLRRALRILLAARRRDDGAVRHIDG